MKHPWILATLFSLSAVVAAPAQAAGDEISPARRAEWSSRLDAAAQRQAEAEQLSTQADEDYAAARQACLQKFLVNACRGEARQRHLAAQEAARAMNSEARAEIRAVRKEEIVARGLPLAESLPPMPTRGQ